MVEVLETRVMSAYVVDAGATRPHPTTVCSTKSFWQSGASDSHAPVPFVATFVVAFSVSPTCASTVFLRHRRRQNFHRDFRSCCSLPFHRCRSAENSPTARATVWFHSWVTAFLSAYTSYYCDCCHDYHDCSNCCWNRCDHCYGHCCDYYRCYVRCSS